MNLSIFLLSTIRYTPIRHEQCIFIIYESAGREGNKLQQLSKLIEVKFITTTWPHLLTLISKANHQKVSVCPKSFLITLKTLHKFSSLLIMKLLLNVNLYLTVFPFHMLSNSRNKYSELFLRPKILLYAQNFQ